MTANLLTFPQSAEQQPSLDSIKIRILGTLADVEADVPTCWIRKPVDIVEIYRFCYMDGSLGEWVRAATELSKAGLVLMWLHLGKTCIEFTELGKEHVLIPPEPPDFPVDQGDETDGGICALPFNEQEQVSGERAEAAPTLRATGPHGFQCMPPTATTSPDVISRPRTIQEISGPLASKQMDSLAAERICDHCKEHIPVSSGSIYWRGMLFHLEQGRDCRMDFIVANKDKIDHRTGQFSKAGE